MTLEDAIEIWHGYYDIGTPTEADDFAFVEASEYLIGLHYTPDDVTGKAAMVNLGAFYYERQDFTLALKYYEMAYDAGDCFVASNLGYIWYYGRTGKVDYQKAFFYYSEAMKQGSLIAAYKVADMYKNGYYVAKDVNRYKAMIRGLYPKVATAQSACEPLPEITKRLAEIEAEEGNLTAALSLYEQAKGFLAQRIGYNAFWGDLIVMDEIVCGYYSLAPFDPTSFDFYDLFHLLKSPCIVQFCIGEAPYQVRAVQEGNACAIQFGAAWYRTRLDFFQRAYVDNAPLTAQYDALTEFEVL